MHRQNLFAVCAILASVVLAAQAEPLGTGFTYQGRLDDGGQPANGTYDLTFLLYDAPADGTQIYWALDFLDTGVSNGLFALTLDFGPVAFPGDARWLEIRVRRSGTGDDYMPLAPRQSLAPAPYAFYAPMAGTAAAVASSAVTAPGIAAGEVVKSLNGLRDHVSLVAGANVTLTPSGNTLTIASAGGGGGADRWSLNGNSGVGAGFLGTLDAWPLELRVNNTPVLRLELNGASPNVIGGFGENYATQGVAGAAIGGGGLWNVPNRVTGDCGTVAGGAGNQAGESAVVGGGAGNYATAAKAVVAGGQWNQATLDWATVSGGINNNAAGRGATVPGGNGNAASGDNSLAAGTFAQANHPGAFVWGDASYQAFASTAPNQFIIRAAGGVGINTNAPQSALHVAGTATATAFAGDGSALTSVNADLLNGVRASAFWKLGGNNGTTPGTDFLGTTDNQPLEFRANGNRGLRLSYASTFTTPYYDFGMNVVAGDENNTVASGVTGATIAGGGLFRRMMVPFNEWHLPNTVVGTGGAIGGGYDNTAGEAATVPGGTYNSATGRNSFAAGYRAKANHTGAFVWADSSGDDFESLRDNIFMARAAGGVNFYSHPSGLYGVSLAPGAGSWSTISDRNAKEHCTPVSGREVLEKLATLPLQAWNYKSQEAAIRHLGPMAQDFRAAFGLGENDVTISTVDADGVALAAIQGLNQKLEEKLAGQAALLRARETELWEIRERLAAVEKLLSTREASR